MIFDISVKIKYSYEFPAGGGRHGLRLFPFILLGVQTVHSSKITLDPIPYNRVERTDFFQNPVTDITYHGPISETEFHMSARVERHAHAEPIDSSPPLQDLKCLLDAHRDLGPASPHHFLGTSNRIPIAKTIQQWAYPIAAQAGSVFAIAREICTKIYEEMTFDLDSTAVNMPVVKAFKARRGVCQDYTHIAIDALRGLGIPAGYVSGVMRTLPPEGQPRLEGADAMHAWVMVWCGPEMGWTEFDPTNNILPRLEHIVIARGRDYFDVAPVKGALMLSGEQKTEQLVDVIEVQ